MDITKRLTAAAAMLDRHPSEVYELNDLCRQAALCIDGLRLQIKEGCDAARNFGGEVVGDDDEPKWCVAAAIVADRRRRIDGEHVK